MSKKYYIESMPYIDDKNNRKCFESDYVKMKYGEEILEGKIDWFDDTFFILDL